MASLKPIVRNKQVKADGKTNIKIRISHGRKVRYIATPWDIQPKYMLDDGTASHKHPSHTKLNGSIQLLISQYNEFIYDMGSEVDFVDCNALVTMLKNKEGIGGDFIEYTRQRIQRLKNNKKFALADSYELTVNHVIAHANKQTVPFKQINVSFLQDLEFYFKYKGLAVNSISVYMRNIRAIFNDAIDQDLIKPGLYPFRKYKIPHETTRKRALTVEQLRLLRTGTYTKGQQKALDLFFLSFYLLGMNFIDMLYAQKANIENNRLVFRRKKTGRLYSIKIHPEADEIIKRYQGDDYLLKFMEHKQMIAKEDRSTQLHKDVIRETNKRLTTAVKAKKQEIEEKEGKTKAKILDTPISTYYARHSWATIAAGLGISRDVISHALGHNIDTTTDIYIDFDLEKVDKANRLIIDHLK